MRLLACLLVSLAAVAPPQSPMPAVGRPAPPFAFSEVVATAATTAPDVSELTPEALRGGVVVLDFFATWCLPCVASIEHTNRLIEATRDLPVVFLAVANEDRATLERFLARPEGGGPSPRGEVRHAMQATLVLDRDGETYRNYRVRSLPFVVVIAPDRRIAAFEHPERLSRETLVRALNRSEGGLIRRPPE